MHDQELVQAKLKLEELKSEESKRGDTLRDGLRESLSESVEELSLYDNHPADVGDVTFERQKDLGLLLFVEDRLARIDEALEAIEQGKYGICEICKGEINRERLQAIPYTTLCQDCQKEHESKERPAKRPIEEAVMNFPFGGLQGYHEDLEDNAFDGEDTWQTVAKYGSSDSPSDIGSVKDYNEVYINSDEDVGTVEDYEKIVAKKSKDGQIYQEFK
jgi:YteA family regulatory protein